MRLFGLGLLVVIAALSTEVARELLDRSQSAVPPPEAQVTPCARYNLESAPDGTCRVNLSQFNSGASPLVVHLNR